MRNEPPNEICTILRLPQNLQLSPKEPLLRAKRSIIAEFMKHNQLSLKRSNTQIAYVPFVRKIN